MQGNAFAIQTLQAFNNSFSNEINGH